MNVPPHADPLIHVGILDDSFRLQRAKAAAGFRDRLGILWSAREAVVSCMASAYLREDLEYPVGDVKSKVWRASIHTAITQGIDIVEHTMATATYVQASVLVRQEMEAVECLRGIRSGQQKSKSSPRLVALRHLVRPYSQLTGLAHLSEPALLAHITDVLGSGVDINLNPEFEAFLFCIHLVSLVGIAFDIADLRPFSSNSISSLEETELMQGVCGLLSERGYLTVE